MIVIIFGPITQFLLFKFTPIYNLNLYTKLYDDADWVKGYPKVLIMGSSHAKYHIIPELIMKMNKQYRGNDVVNIGEDAASPFEMYRAYLKQKKKFKNLEIVYYTLDPHMLGEKYYLYNKYEKIFLSYAQWDYLSREEGIKNEYFFPFQTFIHSLKIRNKNRSKKNGFVALKHKKFKLFKKSEVAKDIFTPFKLFPISKFQIKYLRKLKEEFVTKGVKFVFVLTPSYDWTERYKTECVKYDNALIGLLQKSLGESIIIGSLWGEDFNLSYDDFKDNTHLAYTGAEKFTEDLFSDIKIHKKLKGSQIKNLFTYRWKK